MNKKDVVNVILKNKYKGTKEPVRRFAPANIALCKYWGKRNQELNLPITSSLSVSLGELGTSTTISLNTSGDEVFLNNQPLDANSQFRVRIRDFLNLFRPEPQVFFSIKTQNSIPTSAGLASSASGFAALTLALNTLFSWHLDRKQLSILARLGSGSACRSIYSGFVEWTAGTLDSGMDSVAEPLTETWPELRVGVLEVSREEKPLSSRDAMQRTLETSKLYGSWPTTSESDLHRLKAGITAKDFSLIGRIAESNALSMHATMIGSWPPILYWLPETVETFRLIWELRRNGLEIYFTIDAGPNIKLLFLAKDSNAVTAQFPNIKIVVPFP